MFTVDFVPITPVIAKKVTPRNARILLRIVWEKTREVRERFELGVLRVTIGV